MSVVSTTRLICETSQWTWGDGGPWRLSRRWIARRSRWLLSVLVAILVVVVALVSTAISSPRHERRAPPVDLSATVSRLSPAASMPFSGDEPAEWRSRPFFYAEERSRGSLTDAVARTDTATTQHQDQLCQRGSVSRTVPRAVRGTANGLADVPRWCARRCRCARVQLMALWHRWMLGSVLQVLSIRSKR
jgi:hypothetical protein